MTRQGKIAENQPCVVGEGPWGDVRSPAAGEVLPELLESRSFLELGGEAGMWGWNIVQALRCQSCAQRGGTAWSWCQRIRSLKDPANNQGFLRGLTFTMRCSCYPNTLHCALQSFGFADPSW